MTMKDKSNLIWIDLEMTGLDTQRDYIIEIASIVTDKNLNILAEGPNLAIHQPDEVMNNMDDWNTKQHGRSGLIDKVKKSTINETKAESETVKFLEQYIFKGHTRIISCIMISQDENLVVSGSWDKTLRLFSYDSQMLVQREHKSDLRAKHRT